MPSPAGCATGCCAMPPIPMSPVRAISVRRSACSWSARPGCSARRHARTSRAGSPSGRSGSGRLSRCSPIQTTTLNALSAFIPEGERVVTIEDTAELRLQQAHVVRLEARPANVEGRGEVTVRRLVRNALRMRPDRIVVGEVRGGEALDMLAAMSSGHDGSINTVHSNSPRDALSRVETMSLMAGMDLPIRANRDKMAMAVQLGVQQDRLTA